jgi:acetylornithine deacetylase/succinyl-diaminopimelate desuccinylase-like protein
LKHPALTYALRGISAMELKIHGPSCDLHSGIYGGSVDNPAMALCQLLAQLRDKNGRITIPGFYDDVVPLTKFERKQLARIPHNDAAFRKFLGIPRSFGERGYTSMEQRTARPTLEINGLTSGYQGEGSKTIIPSWASAKLTFRLVPNQTPRRIHKLVTRHLKRLCPASVRIGIEGGHGGEPYLVSPTGLKAQAALRALKSAFGCEPILLREGGSIPILTDFKKILAADALLLGLALPDDNPHSPNEKFQPGRIRQRNEDGGSFCGRSWRTLVGSVGQGPLQIRSQQKIQTREPQRAQKSPVAKDFLRRPTDHRSSG